MRKVTKILEDYDDKTLKDGFIAVLDDGEKKAISDTAWETADRKTITENGVIFEGDIFFGKEQVADIKKRFIHISGTGNNE